MAGQASCAARKDGYFHIFGLVEGNAQPGQPWLAKPDVILFVH
jgi:hypothetical protein